jgi:hypothetical protein
VQLETLWAFVRVGALSLVLALAAFATPSLSPFEPAPIVQAGDDGDDEDDEEREDEDEEDNDAGDAESEGREVRGQVVGVYNPQNRTWTKASPSTMFDEAVPPGTEGLWHLRIGQIGDVIVPVAVYNPDEIGRNGVSMGDHISIDGEYTAGYFYGLTIEVEDQF